TGFVRWWAHPELDRALDFDEGLTLAVDVPAAVPPIFPLQLGVDLIDFRRLLPLPQGPLGRPVDAGVEVVFIEIQQPGDQRRSLARRESVGSVGPQSEDQRPSGRGLGVEEDRIHRRPLTWARCGEVS